MKRPRAEIFLLLPAVFGAWCAIRYADVNAAPGETGLAALSLLHHGTLADPYLLPTGPTAHVSPLHALLLAAVYAVCGGNSHAARIVLGLLAASAYVACAYGVLWWCRRMKAGRLAMAAAITFTCIVPVYLPHLVLVMRQWDQPYAAILLLASLLICTDPALLGRRRYRPEAALGLLAGAAGLTAPSIMPAILLSALRTGSMREGLSRVWRPWLLTLACALAFLLPWGSRNEAALGGFVLTRSNAPLELAAGNDDGATGFADRTSPIHPHDSVQAAQHMRAVGELPYMAEMKTRALSWIRTHPAGFAALTVRRMQLLFFPGRSLIPWMPLFGPALILAVLWVFSAARLWAAFAAPRSWGEALIWWAHCLLPLAPYAITHVSLRYAYPVFFPGVCLICLSLRRLHEVPHAGAREPALNQ